MSGEVPERPKRVERVEGPEPGELQGLEAGELHGPVASELHGLEAGPGEPWVSQCPTLAQDNLHIHTCNSPLVLKLMQEMILL